MPGIQPGHERSRVRTDAVCCAILPRNLRSPNSVFEEETVPSEDEPARRGRPRNTAVDQRVLDVACDLLLTGGYAGLNVDEVAERAAVAKTTLYK